MKILKFLKKYFFKENLNKFEKETAFIGAELAFNLNLRHRR